MFEKFHKNFNDALVSIQKTLNIPPEQYDYNFVPLVRWMLETDANPYAYLPNEWASASSTAEGFALLVHVMHHALYDDGDITFVSVNGEPRIVFACKHEDNFKDYVLSDTEKITEKRLGEDWYKIEILDITPEQFSVLYEQYQKTQLKKCFLIDAARDIEWAAKYYRVYKCWSDQWLKEAREKYSK